MGPPKSGNIFIRYLSPEAEIGDPTPGFLTVGTYPVGDGYVAYPDSAVQIEVYDPDPERAMNLATSGDVQPVG